MQTVNIAAEKLKGKVEHGHDNNHKPFSDIELKEGQLWRTTREVITDPELMNKIIFCNDILQIPPVEVFLALPKTKRVVRDLDLKGKEFLVGLFEYIFKFIFEYQERHTTRIDSEQIDTAAYYAGCKGKIKVVE